MNNRTLVPPLTTTAASDILPVNAPDRTCTLGGPDAAGSPMVGGVMVQRLTHSLTCAVSNPGGAQVGGGTIHNDLLVHLMDLCLAQGQLDQAEELLATSTATGGELPALTAAYLLSRRAELESRKDDPNERNTLQALWASQHLWSDADLLIWVGVRLAKDLSRDGQHAEAMEMLTLVGGPVEYWGPALHAAAGTLLRRQGNHAAAIQHLDQAQSAFSGSDHDLQRALIMLDKAACDLQLMHWDEASDHLVLALKSEMVKQVPQFLRALEELPDLLEHGILDPYCTQAITPVLPFLQIVNRSGMVDPEQITVLCLGCTTALRGRQIIPFSTPWASVLLAALAIEPGLTLRDLEKLFVLPAATEQEVQDGIADLREHISPDVLSIDQTQNPPTYRLRPDLKVQVDMLECRDALQEGNLDRAMLLYRGRALPGFYYSTMISKWRALVEKPLYERLQAALNSALEDEEFVGLRPSALVFEEWLRDLSWEIIGADFKGWTD